MSAPNIGTHQRRRCPPPASTCEVDCFACGAPCTYLDHFKDGGRWREACCTRCSWTDRRPDHLGGEDPHPEG